MILFRDDDINKYTDLSLFLKIQAAFNEHKKLHTVAVEMEGLWENKGIWHVVVTNLNLKVDYSCTSRKAC